MMQVLCFAVSVLRCPSVCVVVCVCVWLCVWLCVCERLYVCLYMSACLSDAVCVWALSPNMGHSLSIWLKMDFRGNMLSGESHRCNITQLLTFALLLLFLLLLSDSLLPACCRNSLSIRWLMQL